MGNPKQKWTTEEEEALKAGVAKHGAGKWKNIQRDPEFNPYLFSRSNIDLKDKWRNMTVNAGEKSRPSKPKATTPLAPPTPVPALPPPVAAAPAPVAVTSASVIPAQASPASASAPALGDIKIEDSKSAVDMINTPRYTNGMIFEAISSLNESNGADVPGIIDYIQQRQQLPLNHRKQLVARLRKLVGQQKLEKVQNVYKIIKTEPSLETKTPAPEENDIKPRYIHSASPKSPRNPLKDAADAVALRAAEAENKSFDAAEAVKESERVSRMAEEGEALLQLAQELLQKCLRGEEVLLRV